MMRVFFLIIFSGSTAYSVSAQNAVDIGFYGGLNRADARQFNGGSTSSRSGSVFGTFIEIIPPHAWVSYQIELHYIQKGASIQDDASRAHFRFHYLEIPLLFKSTAKFESFRPFVFAGPKIGFLLSSGAKLKTNGTSESINLDKDTEALDFSADMGLGCEYTAGRATLFISTRFSLGLFDIDKSRNGEWYARDFQIVAGTKFNLK